MSGRPNTGGGFRSNGDLWVSYRLPSGDIMIQVYGFRGPEWYMPRQKCLVDSYVLECHPCCGVPKKNGHAAACQKGVT